MNDSDWTAPPTCMIGIPGITRTQTIVGGWHLLAHVTDHGCQRILVLAQQVVAALSSVSFTIPAENTPARYLQQGEVRPGQQGEGTQIRAEITTTFFVLIGIFFPSVTGERGGKWEGGGGGIGRWGGM